MNKNGILIWVCLIVLLFCGCADASDSSKDQAPTPIEEEQRIQDTTEIRCADQEEAKARESIGTYTIANQVTYEFGEEEIFAGLDVIGHYVKGVPYFDLSKVMECFGWNWVSEEERLIWKGDLQYRFDEEEVQRILLDERGSPYQYRFSLIESAGKLMIAQMDMEELFGLQSRWDPETRELDLLEWAWALPESIEATVHGDEVHAAVTIKPLESGEYVLEEPVSIRLVSKDYSPVSRFSSGHSESGLYVMETVGVMLIPGNEWDGYAWVHYRSRPVAVYPIQAKFEAASGEIHVQTGPWEDFILESPTDFYSSDIEVLSIQGKTDDEVVIVQVEALEEGQFVVCWEERFSAEGSFKLEWTPPASGIYRIRIITEKGNIRNNRAHFYFEKR